MILRNVEIARLGVFWINVQNVKNQFKTKTMDFKTKKLLEDAIAGLEYDLFISNLQGSAGFFENLINTDQKNYK
tara:strand:+ start:24359 stop:24580 length:222 start_codon:yes stop_codon:yes gene_type:complete